MPILSRPNTAHQARLQAVADVLLALGPDRLPPDVAKAVISAVRTSAGTDTPLAAPEVSKLVPESPPVAAAVVSSIPTAAAPESPMTTQARIGSVPELLPSGQAE